MLSIRARAVVHPLRYITRITSKKHNCKRDFSKLSYFHNPGKEPLLSWTAGDLIDRATDAFGDTTAVVYPHQNISKTYAEYKKDVFGVPDEEVVEKICVWIKMKPDKTLTPEDIKSFCKDKELPWYKVPEYVLFVDSFPRTQTGKVKKHKMREESKQLLNL